MGVESVSTHTLKNDATTTIVSRTTTIVSEHEEVLADHPGYGVAGSVKKTLRDYWFPSHPHHIHRRHHHHHHAEDSDNDENEDEDEDEEEEDQESARHSPFRANSVMRRAYNYWKSLTQDADETAKDLVIKAKATRDEAAKEAKWAMFGYKREAREAYETAEKKYRDALAAAEKVHAEAHERARTKWFQQADSTQKEVGDTIKDRASELTHEKWDRFKAAVDSLAYNPPKYACSPSSQYWFSLQNAGADSGWDCREIWDHSGRDDHAHNVLKTLPKKRVPIERVHGTLSDLFHQASLKAKTAPSATSFDPTLKSFRDYYHGILDRIARSEQGAIEELDTLADKLKEKLNEAKYHEEQVDSWLTTQWNAVVYNAGDAKDQYERAFKNAIKNIKHARTEAYNAVINNSQKAVLTARNNIREAVRVTKNEVDKSQVHKAVQEASQAFSNAIRETEAKIKTAPRNAYDNAVESFNRETAQLKAKLELAAEAARRSGSSISYRASKSASSVAHQASQSGKNFRDDANRRLNEAKKSADAIKQRASSKYNRATASVSSMWGSATPFAEPLNRVHETYHHLLGEAKHGLFGHNNIGDQHEISSFYGLLTAMYLLLLARQIWLRRSHGVPSIETHGNLHVTKKTRRHSHASTASDEHQEHPEHREKHGKHKHQDKEEHHEHRHHDHHRHTHHPDNSFNIVLHKFTSVVPATLCLLIVLELAGFSHVALHTLFVGLVVSQLLQCGYFNNLMEQLGILDSALGEKVSVRAAREMGQGLAWTIFGLAAAANAIKVLHDE
ncbi:hypothetical protein BGX28_003935 [Mortierella sp. GBA30]|nr:hypothetical protein BGX28_003935 [Mortierella sp. GBA30]